MALDIVSCAGKAEKPAVVFIHGLGMDKSIWVEPFDSRILGGMLPLTVLIGKTESAAPRELRTLFHDLRERDFPVIAWSQRRVSGPIRSVIPELETVCRVAENMSRTGILLVGHSRGGLIARAFISRNQSAVRGLVTIATPHKGSAVAKVASYLAPVASLITPLLSRAERRTFAHSLKRIGDFLQSRALQELLPHSRFFETLRDEPLPGVSYVSAGGTDPHLFTFSFFSFPGALERIIPEEVFPDEMKQGKGDGLVSFESSKMPWAEAHFACECNHAQILFDESLRKTLVSEVERISETIRKEEQRERGCDMG